MTFEEAVKRLFRESFIADDDLRDDEICNKVLEYELKKSFLRLCGMSECSYAMAVHYLESNREQALFADSIESDIVISRLSSEKTISEAIERLSSGNCCVFFNECCEIPGMDPLAEEAISIKISSYPNDKAGIYRDTDIVDLLIYHEDFNLLAYYPVSRSSLIKRFRSLIEATKNSLNQTH